LNQNAPVVFPGFWFCSAGSIPANERLTGARKKRRRRMQSFMQKFWQDESGQDLIEYTLLLAFVALASASLFISAGNSVSGIWSTASSNLVAANAAS
jgi:Flp pilus assembly pilin Flp